MDGDAVNGHGWQAGVETRDLLRRHHRLHVGRPVADHQWEILLEDGTFARIPEETADDRSGLMLPDQALVAIHHALSEWRGLQTHQATETKVLREWLTVEQRRVDAVLNRGGRL